MSNHHLVYSHHLRAIIIMCLHCLCKEIENPKSKLYINKRELQDIFERQGGYMGNHPINPITNN